MTDADDDLGAELSCTPAMEAHAEDGADIVFQCVWCGSLLCTPYSSLWGRRDSTHLGPCPACTHSEWSSQTVPVGPLRRLVRIARRERRPRQAD